MCSTPFGINGRNTRCRPRASRTWPWVLNAFRHQRKEHVGSPGPDRVFGFGCSTPFGINGRNTGSTGVCCLIQVSAQRLSASTEGTLPGPSTSRVPARCSTPFGINGRNTRACVYDCPPMVKCSTPFGINGRNTETKTILNSGIDEMCSTPFGINGRNTPCRTAPASA